LSPFFFSRLLELCNRPFLSPQHLFPSSQAQLLLSPPSPMNFFPLPYHLVSIPTLPLLCTQLFGYFQPILGTLRPSFPSFPFHLTMSQLPSLCPLRSMTFSRLFMTPFSSNCPGQSWTIFCPRWNSRCSVPYFPPKKQPCA